jgi:hypothetical protein
MGSVGDCFDNAMCESFFAPLECQCLSRERFRTQREARLAIFDFIEGFYNRHRRHSALDYESSMSYETKRAESCSMIASAQVSVEAGELLSAMTGTAQAGMTWPMTVKEGSVPYGGEKP